MNTQHSYTTTTNTNLLASGLRTVYTTRLLPLVTLALVGSLAFMMPRLLNAQTLAQALDTPGWTWYTYGPASWSTMPDPSAVGGSSAIAGGSGYAGYTYLQTAVTGPGTLRFYSKAQGVNLYFFSVDGGAQQFPIAGTQWPYTQYTISIPSGFHVLIWDCSFDANSVAYLDNVSFTAGSSPPTISTSSPLPSDVAGTTYNQTLSASGGTLPYTWSIVSGGLPVGLSLSSGGVISGTPSTATNASFTVQVTDNNSLSSTKAFSLTIMGQPSIITTNNSLGISNGLFGFDVSGPASQTLVIDGSTNLVDWTPLQTNVMGDSLWSFHDPKWTNYPGRFYRLRSP
jgi:hypothetical protein